MTVGPRTPRDYHPMFRAIPNLGIKLVEANFAQQAAGGAQVNTVIGVVPKRPADVGPTPAASRFRILRATATFIAAVNGVATNNFSLVLARYRGGARTALATLTFAADVNATAFAPRDLGAIASDTVQEDDVLVLEQVQNGTGLTCPAGKVQVEVEPLG